MKLYCCQMQCEKEAEWDIYHDCPRPDEGNTQSCSEHLGEMMTDAPVHYVYPVENKEDPKQ